MRPAAASPPAMASLSWTPNLGIWNLQTWQFLGFFGPQAGQFICIGDGADHLQLLRFPLLQRSTMVFLPFLVYATTKCPPLCSGAGPVPDMTALTTRDHALQKHQSSLFPG